MKEQETIKLAAELMEKHLAGKFWRFELDNAKKRAGLCSYIERCIYISRVYLVVASDADVRDTILHEVAHAIAGPEAGHGRMWKLTASSIGARPERCAAPEIAKALAADSPWQGTCLDCGNLWGYTRAPKARTMASGCCPNCRYKPHGGAIRWLHHGVHVRTSERMRFPTVYNASAYTIPPVAAAAERVETKAPASDLSQVDIDSMWARLSALERKL